MKKIVSVNNKENYKEKVRFYYKEIINNFVKKLHYKIVIHKYKGNIFIDMEKY